jgi:anti-sigma regulatory factor (Ser/Thr protein kinase)
MSHPTGIVWTGVDPLAGWPAAVRWRRAFPGERQQLSLMRRWLASLLPDCPARDDITLITTELAANAIVHTASGWGGSFVVTMGLGGNVVRVCVADDGADDGPRFLADAEDEHGRGLLVVTGLSTRVGVSGDHRGRMVWADVPWTIAGMAVPATPLVSDREPRPAASTCGRPACPGEVR